MPISKIIAFLLYEPFYQLEIPTTSLWDYKTASSCPKFDCKLGLKHRAEEFSEEREKLIV